MSILDHYDAGLPRDPRNMVGKQVAREIHARTGLRGDFTTGMNGATAFRIANEVHNETGCMDRAHGLFNYHWNRA